MKVNQFVQNVVMYKYEPPSARTHTHYYVGSALTRRSVMYDNVVRVLD
jgi:hypothetical protein